MPDHASYLGWLFKSPSSRDKRTRQLTKLIRNYGLDFDSIAVRGVSGMVMGSVVASRMKKGLIVVRKDEGDNHSGRLIEYGGDPQRYIIIDDLIATGETFMKIFRTIRGRLSGAKCVGVFTYYDNSGHFAKRYDIWGNDTKPVCDGLEYVDVWRF